MQNIIVFGIPIIILWPQLGSGASVSLLSRLSDWHDYQTSARPRTSSKSTLTQGWLAREGPHHLYTLEGLQVGQNQTGFTIGRTQRVTFYSLLNYLIPKQDDRFPCSPETGQSGDTESLLMSRMIKWFRIDIYGTDRWWRHLCTHCTALEATTLWTLSGAF